MKSLKRCMSLVLAAVLGVTGMVSGHIADVQAQNCETENTPYVGFKDSAKSAGSTGVGFHLYVIPKDEAEQIAVQSGGKYDMPAEKMPQIIGASEIAYCMCSTDNEPVDVKNKYDDQWTDYRKFVEITDDEIKASCTHNTFDGNVAETKKGLAWIALNGFPNGTSEFRGNLTDDQFREVTQWAVYYYTVKGTYRMPRPGKDVPTPTGFSKEQDEVAKKLITSEYPEDFDEEAALRNAVIYTPSVKRYQHLFSIRKIETTEKFKVQFSKINLKGEELKDAHIQILNDNGSKAIVEKWISDGTTKTIDLEPGEYIFNETKAPDDYAPVDEIFFVVDENGDVTIDTEKTKEKGVTVDENGVVVVTDAYAKHEVEIFKTNIGGVEIAGAQLVVTDAEDKEVDSWTSVEGKNHVIHVEPGTYILTETNAPDGYEKAESIKFEVDFSGNVTVGREQVGEITMVDKYTPCEVEVEKLDAFGNYIVGASLTITDHLGNKKSWDTGDTSEKITLDPGTYVLSESHAPFETDFEVAENIPFEVKVGGDIVVNGKKVDKVTMIDEHGHEWNHIMISKTDIVGNEIGGATLKLTEKDGNFVEEWETKEGQNHIVVLPRPGGYTLTEVNTPEGYLEAAPIEFVVEHDGQIYLNDNSPVDKVVMVDEYVEQIVEISKKDLAGKEIEGATLKVINDEGNLIEEWVSEEGKSHKISLKPGKYALEETLAPKGYEVADNIIFTVHLDGTVTAGENNETIEKVVMVDEYAEQVVEISKTDIAGEEIGGAVLKVFDNGSNVVEEWVSEAGRKHAVYLHPGTYTLQETTAPRGYELAEKITFTVDQNGNVTVDGEDVDEVVMVDNYEKQEITISKVDVKGTPLAGAVLFLTDEEGKLVDEWSTTDTSYTTTVHPGVYVLSEKEAPETYGLAGRITFMVSRDGTITIDGDEVDRITMVDEHEYTVEFSKQDVAGKELKGADIELKNEAGDIIEEWISDGTTRKIQLTPGTYTFEETTAPEGYEIATSITIVLAEDGTITSEDVTVKGEGKNLIVMVDNAKITPDSEPNTPSTGVHANTGMWTVMGVSLAVFAGLFTVRKKLGK